jgi:hypothetical protein
MFFKVKKETIEKGGMYNTRVTALLQAASNPPGFFGKLFGQKTDRATWEEARDRLNKKVPSE